MDRKTEQSKRHQFDAYCKKILRNEARDAYDERKRRQGKEVLFSEMSPRELGKLSFTPEYFRFEQLLRVRGIDFIVNDEGLFEALGALSAQRREIVLLSYYMGLTHGQGNRAGRGNGTCECPVPQIAGAEGTRKHA